MMSSDSEIDEEQLNRFKDAAVDLNDYKQTNVQPEKNRSTRDLKRKQNEGISKDHRQLDISDSCRNHVANKFSALLDSSLVVQDCLWQNGSLKKPEEDDGGIELLCGVSLSLELNEPEPQKRKRKVSSSSSSGDEERFRQAALSADFIMAGSAIPSHITTQNSQNITMENPTDTTTTSSEKQSAKHGTETSSTSNETQNNCKRVDEKPKEKKKKKDKELKSDSKAPIQDESVRPGKLGQKDGDGFNTTVGSSNEKHKKKKKNKQSIQGESFNQGNLGKKDPDSDNTDVSSSIEKHKKKKKTAKENT